VTQAAVAHQGPKCLIYHNITPAHFFTEDLPELAKLVEAGRQDLPGLAQAFPLSVGDSAYNAAELKRCGFAQPGVLPICIDPNNWNIRADPQLMAELQDGRTNLLFVGRLVPNKRQEDLLEAFAEYLSLDATARLILVGPIEIGAPYYERVMALVDRWGLGQQVRVTGLVDDSQLFAYYRTAHVFWSMSEHEGFCVPIVEAMWNDVPVLAYKSSAVPETLAEAGVIFCTKQDMLQLAGLAKVLAEDETVRRKILAAQRNRRWAFLPEAVQPQLEALIEKMEAEV
jgi:glycosyltransferase involved in cell wall biosynthesis